MQARIDAKIETNAAAVPTARQEVGARMQVQPNRARWLLLRGFHLK